jgi:hypothetical protein
VAARKQKQRRMSAQVVEDEDCQLRYEVVAGTGVAKESAVVCVRMPPAGGKKHRTSHLLVGSGRKAREIAAYRIAERKYRIKDATTEDTNVICLLENGHYADSWGNEMEIDDRDSRNLIPLILEPLRALAARLSAP